MFLKNYKMVTLPPVYSTLHFLATEHTQSCHARRKQTVKKSTSDYRTEKLPHGSDIRANLALKVAQLKLKERIIFFNTACFSTFKKPPLAA